MVLIVDTHITNPTKEQEHFQKYEKMVNEIDALVSSLFLVARGATAPSRQSCKFPFPSPPAPDYLPNPYLPPPFPDPFAPSREDMPTSSYTFSLDSVLRTPESMLGAD